ncbi:MAG: hypothetical protein HYR85_23645 [Planctomycetes bacterium]|nr:hypothetical protein [Planctomycetota bacterium]
MLVHKLFTRLATSSVLICCTVIPAVNAAADTDGILVHCVNSGSGSCQDSHATIQDAINHAETGETVLVGAGTYTENLTLNKSLIIEGAQFGVDARGRVASESIVTAAAGTLVTLQTGCAASLIDGFTFSGASRGIESTTGPINSITVSNNRFVSFTGSGLFLNDIGADITISTNLIDGSAKTTSGDLLHLDTDTFNGMWILDNWILNGATATGIFVDGNRNV